MCEWAKKLSTQITEQFNLPDDRNKYYQPMNCSGLHQWDAAAHEREVEAAAERRYQRMKARRQQQDQEG